MRLTLSKYCIALMMLLLGQQANALALSEIEVNSSLNQPLNAKIYLKTITQEELNSLKLDINDISETTANPVAAQLKYEILENENGHYINITSRDVIREPVLSFSLDISWSKGRLIREYSLLIDPR